MSSNAKSDLYHYISDMRNRYPSLCYSNDRDIKGFCDANNIELLLNNFQSRGICGAALVGEKHDTIVLNNCRNELEMGFDFIHELVHTQRHRNSEKPFFTCLYSEQDTFIEWEANEGAAEFLVPYKAFIPVFCELYDVYVNCYNLWKLTYGETTFTQELADRFLVTEMIIINRIKNLSYEIDQYMKSSNVDKISVLSNSAQKRFGIEATDYAGEIECLELEHAFEDIDNNCPPPPISVGF